MALRFEDMLERLGTQGRSAVVDTWKLHAAGLIDRATFLDVASDLLQHINEQGEAYGQLSYANAAAIVQQIEVDLDLGLQPTPNPVTSKVKLRQSLGTVLDGEAEQIEQRLARLGYVLPIEETRNGYAAALRSDSTATGWTRLVDTDGCELCQWWARDGRAWPKEHPMPTHKGCKCQQVPTFTGTPAMTYQQRIIARREEAIRNRDLNSSIVQNLIRQGQL